MHKTGLYPPKSFRLGIVKNPDDFLYSSAADYAGIPGYVKIMKIE